MPGINTQPVLRQLQHLEERHHARPEQAARRASSAERLLPWADIVVESFTPKAMRNWGLDYENLRAIKPDLIMLSTCMQGQTGPNALYPGFGQLMAALSGFYYISGYGPASSCTPPYGAYTRFHRAAIFRVRAAGRARLPAPHRQGPVYRHGAVRGRDAQSRAGADRLLRDGTRARAARQRVGALRAAWRVSMRRRRRPRALDRDRGRERRAVARDAHSARRAVRRCALRDAWRRASRIARRSTNSSAR